MPFLLQNPLSTCSIIKDYNVHVQINNENFLDRPLMKGYTPTLKKLIQTIPGKAKILHLFLTIFNEALSEVFGMKHMIYQFGNKSQSMRAKN